MSHLDPRIAAPRTLVELREEVIKRIKGNGYPGRGIRLPDAEIAMAALQSLEPVGNKIAAGEIAMIKVQAPNMALKIIDDAIQAHGGAGVSNDFGLASAYAHQRTLRLADGPDEVHARAIARIEFGKHGSNSAGEISSGDMAVSR